MSDRDLRYRRLTSPTGLRPRQAHYLETGHSACVRRSATLRDCSVSYQAGGPRSIRLVMLGAINFLDDDLISGRTLEHVSK